MKIKLGFIVGLAIGYYLGTAAGKERHDQLNRLIAKVANSGPVDSASGAAKSAMDSGYHSAKDKVAHKLHHNGNSYGGANEFMPS